VRSPRAVSGLPWRARHQDSAFARYGGQHRRHDHRQRSQRGRIAYTPGTQTSWRRHTS